MRGSSIRSSGEAYSRKLGSTAGWDLPELETTALYAFVGQLLQPYTLLVVTSLVACIVVWRVPKWRQNTGLVATSCFTLLLVLSTPIAQYLALGSLEWWYSSDVVAPKSGDTIVVLAGGHILEDDAGLRIRLGNTSVARCMYALQLYRESGGCRMILTGGKVDWSQPGLTIADAMRNFFLQCGVADEDIVIEDRSSSTYENALFTGELLSEGTQGEVFLVTSATHMWRAERCFRAQGVSVVAAPCDFQVRSFQFNSTSVLPSANSMQGVNDAAHEWVGLVWYWLRGRL